MKAQIAVATVDGKAYFVIVKKLKERNIPFISLIPGKIVPADIKVVITTNKEKHQIKHEKILVYADETALDSLVNEVMKILQGKENYEKIVIGVDPGEVLGLAVIADGRINETAVALSVEELLAKISNIIKDVNVSSTLTTIKIGNGVAAYKELLETLDFTLPPEVILEVVSEAGTNRALNNNKHRRGLRDIASAIRIAGRVGHVHSRRKNGEQNGKECTNLC
jgi:hypothetical protein